MATTLRSGRPLIWPIPVLAVGLVLAIMMAVAGSAFAIPIEPKGAGAPPARGQNPARKAGLPLPSKPIVGKVTERLASKRLDRGSPVFLRIFKEESEFEVWMKRDGQFIHFATYPICHWSGELGPKLVEGDKQSPEGFYNITPASLHRSGRWPLSFNLGFPNTLDRSFLRTGSYLLVHGGCSSVGCYAMTDAVMQEIYGIVSDAFAAGQKYVPVHIFPFRMSEPNLTRNATSEWHDFWTNLKEGYDAFERTRLPPRISVCNGRYQVSELAANGDVGAPISPCLVTAAILEAEKKLRSIIQQPASWPSLSEDDRKLVALLPLPIERIAAQWTPAKSPPKVKARKPQVTIAAAPHVKIQCNLGLVSCRRFLALRQKSYREQLAKGNITTAETDSASTKK